MVRSFRVCETRRTQAEDSLGERYIMRTEDQVRDQAQITLGFNEEQPNIIQGTGQITTFNQLGFTTHPLKNHKPDGWYLPDDNNIAIILEAKSEKEPVDYQGHIEELLKNCSVVGTKYKTVIGILYNGRVTNVFINGDPLTQATGRPLQHKSYYLELVTDIDIDKNQIYAVTQRINNNLHFKFGMTDLQDRMIFTACALVVYSKGLEIQRVKDWGYDRFHNFISEELSEAISEESSARRNDKLNILVEEYAAVKMSITEDQNAINAFIDDVMEIGDMINSRHWRGEDVMGIFFNEFSRYKKKSDAGQVFTPDNITSLMYRLIEVNQNDKVLDATCGSGAFLVKAMSNMIKEAGGVSTDKAKEIKSEQLYGIELYRKVYALACANMLIHKDGKTNLRQMDAKSEEAGAWINSIGITKVLMNPPYERKYGCMKIVKNVLDNVPAGTKAAFILPNTKLDKDGGAKLLKDHTLETIVKLPDKTFVSVSVETAIFIFTAGIRHPEHKKIEAYFIEEDGLETVKNQGRHDVNGVWQDIEDYWVAAIANHEDPEFGTRILLDPKGSLSYPDPEIPFELNMEDFMKSGMDYDMFSNQIDASTIKDAIASTMYGVEQSPNEMLHNIGPKILGLDK